MQRAINTSETHDVTVPTMDVAPLVTGAGGKGAAQRATACRPVTTTNGFHAAPNEPAR
jgi:hypothetical protein